MAVRRRPVLAEFTDRFGDKQVIHRDKGGILKIRRNAPTVVLAMTKTVGAFAGTRIREERVKAGMTGLQLAERAGLKGGKEAIYGIETAMNTGVRLGTLYAIAAALNVSPFSLLPPVSLVLQEAGIQTQQAERLAV
jgi:hypothetical protein